MMKDNKNKEYWRGVKSERKNTVTVGICAAVVSLLVGGFAGYAINKSTAPKVDPYLQKIIDTYDLLDNEWLYGKDINNLQEIMADLMISGLLDNDGDPYTFYTKTEAQQNLSTEGVGFGVTFANYYGRPILHKVHNGTMETKHLNDGDIIISYSKNGGPTVDTLKNGYAQTLADLKSEDDDVYDFTILRDGQEITFTEVGVGRYSEKTVWLQSDETVNSKRRVSIRINTFLGYPAAELKVLLNNLLMTGSIDTLLLDLKDNGGGYVNQMCEIASYFVPKDTVIYSCKDKNGKVVEKATQKAEPLYSHDQIKNVRIVQNGGSASASESFTLALKDTGRADIFGTQSYGKGIAQAFYYFKDGSVIRYTYAYIYGPDGYTIHKTGINPHVETDQDYYLLRSTPIFDTEVPDYSLLTRQLRYYLPTYEYDGVLTNLITEFQTSNNLTVTGNYDEFTYNYLCGLNYDTFWNLYADENQAILSYSR